MTAHYLTTLRTIFLVRCSLVQFGPVGIVAQMMELMMAIHNSSRISIPVTAPADSITITQPPQTATSYFKLAPSQPITIAWNFTDLIVTPTHLTVSAACDNGNTYPVGSGSNGVIPGTATSVEWDIYSYQQNNPGTPLAQAMYTLMIWDDRGPNPQRAPGFLVPNNALRFAIYTPQSYTGLGDGWQCTICSGALSAYTKHPAFTALLVRIRNNDEESAGETADMRGVDPFSFSTT
ncbi:hypothetical protein JOM56_011830 [Amanita muscaria]